MKWFERLTVLLFTVVVVVLIMRCDTKSLTRGKTTEKPEQAKQLDIKGEGDMAAPSAEGPLETVTLKPPDQSQGGAEEEIQKTLAEAARKRGDVVVGILHCHAPGNPESEAIAQSLETLRHKYGNQVQVIRADIVANPEVAKTEGVTKPPKVVMLVGKDRVFSFQGLWPYQNIERKVNEILHGVKRTDRNWRPEVKGMQKASAPKEPTTPPPGK